jgi:imidazolonepropionase-like amidohydrolase
LQGMSFHWEMWAYAMGGMSTAEILRAATIDAAFIIGAPEDLGSIEVGKLADMVILNSNPLDDIRNSVDIDRVIQNGRLYDGDTLEQQWPDQVPFPETWWQTEEASPPGF